MQITAIYSFTVFGQGEKIMASLNPENACNKGFAATLADGIIINI
ncbi:MAG: hypothetical protein ACTHML_19965 [Ginsengibacter sp.]|jgi:hypothetical protein